MIRIQVTCPFTYEYWDGDGKLKKRHYLTAGNYYHLDEEKDKEEIRFVLSPNFIFKNYIYVNLDTVPKELIKELDLNHGFYEDTAVPEDEYIPTLLQNNRFIDASESYITDDLVKDPKITTEPTPNVFDKTTIVESKKELEVKAIEAELKKEDKLGAENTPDLSPLPEVSDQIVDIEINNKERETRKSELEDLHYSKVKEIAELYNIDYNTKKETIEIILNLEFGDNN